MKGIKTICIDKVLLKETPPQTYAFSFFSYKRLLLNAIQHPERDLAVHSH